MNVTMRLLRARRLHVVWALLLHCGVVAAQATHPAFEVATVKAAPGADPNTGSWSVPNTGRFTATHVSLALLLTLAYGVDKSQIANAPGWLDTELYDVAAKPEEGVALNREELKPRLQDLLQQRFHLAAHREVRPTHGYALLVGKDGAHLSPTKGDKFPGYRINVSPGQMRGVNWSMPVLAKNLTAVSDFPVVDETGLSGSYDIGFSYSYDGDPKAEDSGFPSMGKALEEATGLMLKSQMVPVETIVIDSVNKVPAEN